MGTPGLRGLGSIEDYLSQSVFPFTSFFTVRELGGKFLAARLFAVLEIGKFKYNAFRHMLRQTCIPEFLD